MVRLTLSSIIALILMVIGALPAQAAMWVEIPRTGAAKALTSVAESRHFKADIKTLRQFLMQVAADSNGGYAQEITLPMPDGRLARYNIIATSVMAPALAQKFPDIKTFKVTGIDDIHSSGRLDISARGFHGMISTPQGRVFIDPEQILDENSLYLSKARSSVPSGKTFACGVERGEDELSGIAQIAGRPAQRSAGFLQKYSIAVSATQEYVVAVAGNNNPNYRTDAQAAIVTAINRVNDIYERDLGITLELVANNNLLIEGPTGDAGFSNNNAFSMFDENKAWIDSKISNGGYDIGHVFSTGGGGLARLGSTCNTDLKAHGVTGSANPTGDLFYIDFVAHEIGHQFDADHSFNGTSLSCSSNRNASTAFEPGSGSTIMSYAGICGVEDIQSSSDDAFHAGSIAQIDTFTGSGAGNSCATNVLNTNISPVIDSISANVSIPVGTAFALQATASDTDSASVSYQWDQMNTGTATNETSYGTDIDTNPLFRSYEPQTGGKRNFPALGTQLLGFYDDAEVVPCKADNLDFRMTVRDGDSGLATADVDIEVVGTAGPFRISSFTSAETIIASSGAISFNWEVANTNLAPVNCANVAIDMLAFNDSGYSQYAIHPLVASTPNDGQHTLSYFQSNSMMSHPRVRFKLSCTNNAFYDISDANVVISGTALPAVNYADTGNTTFFNNNGTVGTSPPDCPADPATATPVVASSGGGDSGAIEFWWLLLLSSLVASVRWARFRACSRF